MRSRLRHITTIGMFDKDVKALKKKHVDLRLLIKPIQAIMNNDRTLLDTKYRDHALTGNWAGYRELHVEGDWLLIYFIDDDDLVLVLTRTSTHDELYSAKTRANDIRSYKKSERRPMRGDDA